ncbi:MBOAT family O-acyltransferase [Parabacteroides sp.]
MLFNSFEFALYLPIVFLLYWFVFNRNIRWQNLFVVIASYVFYGWWDTRFLLLIGLTTCVSFVTGLWIDCFRKQDQGKTLPWYKNRAQLVCAGNILFNLGILAYFKYCNFFIESFVDFFRLFGVSLTVRSLQVILPVGISFYTFQALSYSIDVYKGKLAATRDVVSFFAFVSFFPQLVAGPIERATNLLPQFYKERTFSYPAAVDGLRQILWGLFKKVVIADNCACLVDTVYDSYASQSAPTLIIAAVCFSFQIYCDFSGYSDVAIGTARLFGFRLMRNFNYPYLARDVAEFWRRWHISLTTWFRDYVYIPLGGSRGSRWQNVRNTLVIFVLSGIWHGANFTFLAWGTYSGLLFLPLLLGKKNRRYTGVPAEGKSLPSAYEMLSMIYTFILITIGWVFFRSETIHQAFDFLSTIIHASSSELPRSLGVSILFPLIGLLMISEWFQRDKEHVLQIDHLPQWGRYSVYYLLIGLCFTYAVQEEVPFIYFQF